MVGEGEKMKHETTGRLRIALQKSGRLAEDSLGLLKKSGLKISRRRDDLLCRISELPIDVLLVRDDDIPGFVSRGICDLGIVGENVFAEEKLSRANFKAQILMRLGFSACRLVIAAPEGGKIKTESDLKDAVVATTYPALFQRYAAERGLNASYLEMSGSVEVAPRLHIADAICDIVASGATLAANNLVEITTVLRSEALLIRGEEPLAAEKEAIIARLLPRFQGALQAEDSKYIMLHAPKEHLADIIRLLPGAESPTLLPLQGRDDLMAVHAVCRESVFWETMEQIKEAGGSAILVLPIEKMMG
jgi:ATP phosphoribosyltransferase